MSGDDLVLSSPKGKWARATIAESLHWHVIPITPNSLVDVIGKCSPSTPLVFSLRPGRYLFDQPLVLNREAPCVLKADGAHVVFASQQATLTTAAGAASDKRPLPANAKGASSGGGALANPPLPRALLSIEGPGGVVLQGIEFDTTDTRSQIATVSSDAAGSSSPSTLHSAIRSCLTVCSTGNVCIAECRFAAACGANAADVGGAGGGGVGVTVIETGGMFMTQCEFVCGDVGIRFDVGAAKSKPSRKGALGNKPPSGVRDVAPLVSIEDCGFIGTRTQNDGSGLPGQLDVDVPALRRAIYCAGTAVSQLRVVVDHSSFDGVVETFLETSRTTPSGVSVSVEHSTLSRCGNNSVVGGTKTPSLILRGYAKAEILDCTLDQCGVLLLCHESSCSITECTMVAEMLVKPRTSEPLGPTYFLRQVVVQDRACLMAQKNEWTGRMALEYGLPPHADVGNASDDAHTTAAIPTTSGDATSASTIDAPSKEGGSGGGASFAFLVLISTGRIVVEGNLFQMQRAVLGTAGSPSLLPETSGPPPLAHLRCAAVLAALVVDGSSAPIVHSNTVHCETDLTSAIEPTTRGLLCIRGALLGLWHDAKFHANTFTGLLHTDVSYCALEDHPAAAILAQRHLEAMTEPWGDDAPTTPSRSTPAATADEADSNGNSTSATQLPTPRSASRISKGHRGTAVGNARHDSPTTVAATREDDETLGGATAKATICKLRQQVAALKRQLHDQQTATTMTDMQVKPPSTSRPTSARPTRPSSARTASTSSRPTSASVSRPSTASGKKGKHSLSSKAFKGQPTTAHKSAPPNGGSEDDERKEVRIGEYNWDLSRMKAFMQGRIPLSQVRRASTPDELHPQRANSPTRIYDEWKRLQTERLEEEQRLLAKQKEESASRNRKLTPRQQQEMVQRIHTESIEHQKEVRERWMEEEFARYSSTGRASTMRDANAVAESEGEFQERLEKDMKDRVLRRELLIQKYVPERPPQRRTRSEIEAYTSSLYRAHRDAGLVAKAEAQSGAVIRVAPPRSGYREHIVQCRVLTPAQQEAYCASLHESHKNEQLAERASAIAGTKAVARVGARSASRALTSP